MMFSLTNIHDYLVYSPLILVIFLVFCHSGGHDGGDNGSDSVQIHGE